MKILDISYYGIQNVHIATTGRYNMLEVLKAADQTPQEMEALNAYINGRGSCPMKRVMIELFSALQRGEDVMIVSVPK